MKSILKMGWIFLFLFELCLLNATSGFAKPSTENSKATRVKGTTFISPNVIEAGAFTPLKLTYEVGQVIQAGGGIKIQFPRSFGFSTWMYASEEHEYKQFQTEDPKGFDYIGATSSNANVQLKTLIHPRDVINRSEEDSFIWWSSFVFEVRVEEGTLQDGDTLYFHMNRSSSSVVREVVTVHVAVDPEGDGTFTHVQPSPGIKITAAKAEEILLYGPSQGTTGEPVSYRISVLDKWGNQAEFFEGRVFLTVSDPEASFPKVLDITPDMHGIAEFQVRYTTPGIHRVTLTDNKQLANAGVLSNPVRVGDSQENREIYWGELHAHSRLSAAAIGEPEGAYQYGRDVANLDFMALTPQRMTIETPREEEYEINRALVKKYHVPHEFVTFLGLEWQADHHNNIIYRNDNEQVPFAPNYPTLESLFGFLKGKDALVIPHHTGIRWDSYKPGHRRDTEKRWVEKGREGLKTGGPVVDWSFRHPQRRLGEIYSHHGSSEYYMSKGNYEETESTLATAASGPHYFRDAWERGHLLGVVGSTDDHFSHPGRIFGGVTGVYAPELSREAIYNALWNRQTFATTGHRIMLNFTMNDHMMGSVVRLGEKEVPRFHVSASGTDIIATVEIFKYDGFSWTTLFRSNPDALDVELDVSDYARDVSSLYYVRLTQKASYQAKTEHSPRPIMAWSSPIWVTDRDTAWWDLPVETVRDDH